MRIYDRRDPLAFWSGSLFGFAVAVTLGYVLLQWAA